METAIPSGVDGDEELSKEDAAKGKITVITNAGEGQKRSENEVAEAEKNKDTELKKNGKDTDKKTEAVSQRASNTNREGTSTGAKVIVTMIAAIGLAIAGIGVGRKIFKKD